MCTRLYVQSKTNILFIRHQLIALKVGKYTWNFTGMLKLSVSNVNQLYEGGKFMMVNIYVLCLNKY